MIFEKWRNNKKAQSVQKKMSDSELAKLSAHCKTFKADDFITRISDKNLTYAEALEVFITEAGQELASLEGNFPSLFNESQGNDTNLSIAESSPKTVFEALQHFMNKEGCTSEMAEEKAKKAYPNLFKNPYSNVE